MAERRKLRKKKDEEFECVTTKRSDKPTKDELTIAKWLKKNVPVKKTKFAGHNVEYFTGSKAVDALMNSKWGNREDDKEPFFASRDDVVYFLDTMLRHKFFHRAKKVPVSEQELKAKLKRKEKRNVDEEKKKKDDETAESSHAEGREVEEKSKSGQEERQKKCRKIKLEMHFEQMFVDNLDAYVWIYDPIPLYYWVIGTLVVLAAIAVCLFPLWPPTVRLCVQYLSMVGAGFLILMLVLTVVRLIIFCMIWLVTLGKLHFWLLPNLTEDVGVLASFWPLYQYECITETEVNKANEKKKKLKGSDTDPDSAKDVKPTKSGSAAGTQQKSGAGNTKKETSSSGSNGSNSDGKETKEIGDQNENKNSGRMASCNDSETDTESSGKQSQTGKDFEMIENEEAEDKS